MHLHAGLEALASHYGGGLTRVFSQRLRSTQVQNRSYQPDRRPFWCLTLVFLHTLSPHFNTTLGSRCSDGTGTGSAVDTCFKICTGPSETPALEVDPILKD